MTVEPGESPTPMSERMQSLLSRAVEDQLSEQRQLAAALGEVRNQLARLAQEVEALRANTREAPSIEPALGAVSGEVREAVRLLAERLDGVARLVQQRGSDLAEIRAAIAELETTTRAHGEALGGISGGLGALPAYGDRIAGLQDNVAGLHERLGAVDGIGTVVTTLHQRIDTMDKDLRELRSAFTAIGARMAELPGRGDVESAVARGAAPIGEVDARLARLEGALAALADRLESAQDRGDDDERHEWLRSELARFAESVSLRADSTVERLGTLESSVQALTAQLEDALAEDEDFDAADDEPDARAVLAELAELREALLGSGGLTDRVEALADDDVDQRVGAAVAAAVSAAEERLAAHIDEAVLALAQAVLRRRPRTTPSPVTASAAAPPAAPEPDREPERELDAVDAGALTPGSADVEGAQPDESTDAAGPEEQGRRRRPWWRPGD